MALDWFPQGPMTQREAEELASRYRSAGREVRVTPSFDIGKSLVMVRLPVTKNVPRPSSDYQQKMWK
ncbi:hypothetical protein ABU549_004437 [Yersinia enterocolitica]|jgi:hypothetical protein